MSNPKRGELEVNLNGQSYQCKITMDVIMRIETNVGRGILKIAQGLQDAEMSAAEMVLILTPVLRSSGADLKDREVGNIIWDAGFAEGLRVIAEIIVSIIGGDDNEGNELKAVKQA